MDTLMFSKLEIEAAFPGLVNSDYEITSPREATYNCIAWAAGCNHRWWWPGMRFAFWPSDLPHEETLEVFKKLFEKLGYAQCEDLNLEAEFEKVAIFFKDGKVTHAARQLATGKWASKLGQIED